MPNFNTHWCIALQALPATPLWLQVGYALHVHAARLFRGRLHVELAEEASSVEHARDIVWRVCDASNSYVTSHPQRAAMVAFSAYAFGACGPDIWTIPQAWRPPTVGEHHFDLGHYNRTHQQFQVFLRKLALQVNRKAPASLAQQAYYLGMATHLGADLVVHQLVNRTAGAYDLLQKVWRAESGDRPQTWNTHNKIEHFWDTYLRARYLSDYGPVFMSARQHGQGGASVVLEEAELRRFQISQISSDPLEHGDWLRVHGLPIHESLLRRVAQGALGNAGPPRKISSSRLLTALDTQVIRCAVDQWLNLPRLFCDDLDSGALPSFVYDVALAKEDGAYPTALVNDEVAAEARSAGLADGLMRGRRSERSKAAYFTTGRNRFSNPLGNAYLTNRVCPSLDDLRKKIGPLRGKEPQPIGSFFSLPDLEPFLKRAVEQASAFARELTAAFEAPLGARLPLLANHWNLDTGLGLSVQRRGTTASKDVQTVLDFRSVLDPDLGGVNSPSPLALPPIAYNGPREEAPQFSDPGPITTLHEAAAVPNLRQVQWPADGLLSELRIESAASSPAPAAKPFDDFLLSFFADGITAGPIAASAVGTAASQATNVLAMTSANTRLNLEVRVAISNLGSDSVGAYLFSRPGIPTSAKGFFDGPGKPRVLLQPDRAPGTVPPRASAAGARDSGGLQTFSTRVFANLGPVVGAAKSESNILNLIPRAIQEASGPHFCVATGRGGVLVPTVPTEEKGFGRSIDPDQDFKYYADVSPTEQIYFTVVPLVRTSSGVIDALTGQVVKLDQIAAGPAKMKRTPCVDAIEVVGLRKLVMFYEVTDAGGRMLDWCLIDGEPTLVGEAPAERAPSSA